MNIAMANSLSPPISDQPIVAALNRLNSLVASAIDDPGPATPLAPVRRETPVVSELDAEFFPEEPLTLAQSKVSESMMEELITKFLMAKGEASIRQISHQVGMAFSIVEKIIVRLKQEQLLGYVDQATMNDYLCRLTEAGRERAKRYSDSCTYYGSAPVDFNDYVDSVKKQSITKQNPTEADLARAFADLLIEPSMMLKLGPAVNSGRGMFLFGYPGNGKTSIAERITAAFGPHVWIPRSITVDRDIVRVFDPMQHVEAPLEKSNGFLSDLHYDHRWVRIKRPTIVVGGELTMEHLEIQYNPRTGISEAPVQLKSNTGLLLIDDFGRQRMSVDELLNRWIVPLEKRYDFLNTSNGKKVQVPFDQLVVFSTNLEPKDLVDDAFLRRIPYKIEVPNPSPENFIKLFAIMCRALKVEFKPEIVQYLLQTHYFPINRPLRNCHPRDLLLQVINYCKYRKLPVELTRETIDFACENYFSVI
jgi:predicted ATPase with chaperone activity